MPSYDVVIVGARVAGAATGMLLARAGHRVLVVDRARYGSDTLSTHALMRGAVVQLQRWGLLDRIAALGTPPVRRVTFDYSGAPVVVDLPDPLYAPRRTVLDRVLVDAAREAGADVRFGTTVTDLRRDVDGHVRGVVVRDADGGTRDIDATLTVGADGMRSRVARAVGPPVTRTAGHSTATFYGHVAGLEDRGYEWYYGPGMGAGVIPTNDGMATVFVGTSPDRFHRELRGDPEAGMTRLLRAMSPELAERMAATRRQGPLRGFAGAKGWMRRPFGDGWALVGDAAYFKDPLTAHGMTDALRDAELLARAADEGLRGASPMAAALAGYERVRDDLALPLFDTTSAIAALDWTMPQVQQLHVELSREMKDETRFIRRLDAFPVRTGTRALATIG